jgi:hypothetical protein
MQKDFQIILVSAKDEYVCADLVILHKLPIDICLYLPGDKVYRDYVVSKLKGTLEPEQLVGCFTLEERQALLMDGAKKDECNKASNKVVRNTKVKKHDGTKKDGD